MQTNTPIPRRAVRRDVHVKPFHEDATPHEFYHAKGIGPAITKVAFLEPKPGAEERQNYEQMPLGSGEVQRVTELGFGFNGQVVRISGGTSADTVASVTAFLNNLAAAIGRFTSTRNNCDVGDDFLVADYLPEYEIQYLSATEALVVFGKTQLYPLLKPLRFEPEAIFGIEVEFPIRDGFANANYEGTLIDGLQLEVRLGVDLYPESASGAIGEQVRKATLGEGTIYSN